MKTKNPLGRFSLGLLQSGVGEKSKAASCMPATTVKKVKYAPEITQKQNKKWKNYPGINSPTHFPSLVFLNPTSHLPMGVFGNSGSTMQVEWLPHLTSAKQGFASA